MMASLGTPSPVTSIQRESIPMSTRKILALAAVAGLLSAPFAMAQTSTGSSSAPSTAAPSTPAPSTPPSGGGGASSATTGKATHAMTRRAMSQPAKSRRAMPAHATSGTASRGGDSGNAAVDALNAQSLARARSNPPAQ